MTQATWRGSAPFSSVSSDRATLERLDRFATFLDSAVRVPGTGIRVGADAALGLVPGIGNLASTLLSAWLLREAWRLGVPVTLLLRMLGNIAFDSVVSAVPVAGNVLDVFWRANRRNVALLARHLDGRATRHHWRGTI
ncbi:conserved protein of unknown function [Rhodovastum atsumiense]|uniref:DUF4112 domain-containing protein n=1 Tax=Rhodovastum atsumiense TaxID=504468 RepID=A0A5M6ISH0_9PROT|nr:DUF4112 domain-containing protein [Rhodovastum atsumiense]KAA5611260.1 DUF4112 domain-containing protein [Rhodovastum atsumiense]CAH2603997.1 conserved protein of unknown function [Rhodovastum atsumiense]